MTATATATRTTRNATRCPACQEGHHLCCAGYRVNRVGPEGEKIYLLCYCECGGRHTATREAP